MAEIDIKKIKPNPNNPRIIKDEKFKKLVQSLKDLPEMAKVRPIVVNQDMIVLGGNMRLKAMQEAGWKKAPVEVVDWEEDKQRQFIIKDNVGFGEWDWEQLANNWDSEQLSEWGLDLPPMEVQEHEAEEDNYEMPDVVHTDIVLGDLFEIGEHRLLCGDSTDSDQVAKLMNGEKADMVFTDPPYGVSYQSNMRTKTDKFEVLQNDNVFITEWINNLPLFSNGFVFVWTSWKVLKQWIEFCEPIGELSNLIIWDKGGGGIGDLKKTFLTDFEVALCYNRGAEIKGKRLGSVWNVGKDSSSKYLHPTQKPVELSAMAIENVSIKNDLVLDLFIGSGSTMVASHQLKRKCYGMELDPKYCQVIVDRMLKLDPTLEVKRNGKPYKINNEITANA
ncbi:MAG: ParB N-terminal domain-containing protein [Bacteroidetes bacterium]|nr:ParB N-terminal domain-containing protein [Bacteroidota bacterium]